MSHQGLIVFQDDFSDRSVAWVESDNQRYSVIVEVWLGGGLKGFNPIDSGGLIGGRRCDIMGVVASVKERLHGDSLCVEVCVIAANATKAFELCVRNRVLALWWMARCM